MSDDLDIRKLPQQTPRVESGPVQFGEDWPGLFLRGDSALYFAMHLRHTVDLLQNEAILSRSPLLRDPLNLAVLRGLLNALESCNIERLPPRAAASDRENGDPPPNAT